MNITHAYVQDGRETTPLNNLRIKKGIPFRELSGMVDAPLSTLYGWMSGKTTPPEPAITKLAKAFDVDTTVIQDCILFGPKNVTPTTPTSEGDHRRGPRKRSNTFWNNKRTEIGFTVAEVTQGLNGRIDKHRLTKYLNGTAMPSDDDIKIICDFFDVDFKEGKREFRKANKAWKKIHRPSMKDIKGAESSAEVEPVDTTEDTKPVSETEVVASTPTSETPEIDANAIGSMLYGTLSYHEFIHVMEAINEDKNTGSVAEILYGQVDFDTFNKVIAAINDSNEPNEPAF